MDKNVKQRIRDIAGKENCSDRKEDLLLYSYDAMNRRYLPDMVAHPSSPDEVSQLVSLANEAGFPIIPRGGGTGLTGGALAVDGGLILTTRRLNRILQIDRDGLTAWVEPGVYNGDLQKAAGEYGLFFPPDPASMDYSTLGGNAAENAGGARAVKYGVTREYVMALEVVMPTGEIIHTGSASIKSVTGYDLTRLMVGSEGTLGIITKLLLKLVPIPEAVGTMLAGFDEIGTAARAVARIMTSRVVPSTLEFMDRSTVECVKGYLSEEIPSRIAALLLIEVDGSASVVQEDSRILEEKCREAGALYFRSASEDEERESLWTARRSISPAIMRIRPLKINEDVAVPRLKIPDLITGIEALARKHDVIIVNFGHAGDGNVHVNLLLDPEDREEVARGHKAVEELFELVVSLGGTLSGEHGIGIAKAPYLGIEIDESTVRVMRKIKNALDPKNILNPHKTFDYDKESLQRELVRDHG
ncbi:MAG: FAD-linked oxidase C-terminal domain-containing protein [Pseudomonadota bacterium]|jgi:glycolate oxidase